jgi:hypothetical protein
MAGLRLRVALRRGALVTAANWPLVAVDFTADALYKAALGVPIVGGALVVAVLAGDDLASILSNGLRSGAGTVLRSLVDAPGALAAFVAALGVVAVGGGVVVCLVRAGTVAALTDGERAAPDTLHAGSIRADALRRADASRIEGFLDGVSRFGRRFVVLGLWLMAAYAVLGAAYLGVLVAAYRWAERAEWISAVPIAALVASSAFVVALSAINLLYMLLQIVVVADDCAIGVALRRLRGFLTHDARQVAGIFGVILTVLLAGAAASIVMTAGLGLVAWVPLVGLAVIPLQAAAWLVRGLVFDFIGLTSLAAYLGHYRRYSTEE